MNQNYRINAAKQNWNQQLRLKLSGFGFILVVLLATTPSPIVIGSHAFVIPTPRPIHLSSHRHHHQPQQQHHHQQQQQQLGSQSRPFQAVTALSSEAPPPKAVDVDAATALDADGLAQQHVYKKPTGTSFLPVETVERAKQGSPIEKMKLEKDGTAAFVDVYEYARKIRNGEMTWEQVEKADLDSRLKWVGMLHRNKRTPGQFMMRLRVPNGICTSDQFRFYASCVERYGPQRGVVDITTRQNIQLRGVTLEDAPDIIDGLHARNQTSFQSALDNVRNMVGSPLAGIDDMELVDTRELCQALDDWISLDPVTQTRGNPMWGNLPRKFNIAISGSRDDFAHTHMNDIGLQPCRHAETGIMGFNVVLGGYMSIKRVAHAIDANMWIPADRTSVVALANAILRVFRDEGERKDRQKARLMWLVEKYGVPAFRKRILDEMMMNQNHPDEAIAQHVVVCEAQPPPPLTTDTPFQRRELLGVHPQRQAGKVRVGIHVPTGRLSAAECRDLADLADKYSQGEIRLTVEQNIILPNVDEALVSQLLSEPALTGGATTTTTTTTTTTSRLQVFPGKIEGHVVSCTGAEFCGLALIETKSNAERVGKKLEELVSVHRPIRIHWTGCPNSCAQVQVADIGIMGGPARKEIHGKSMAVPGCKIFVGGRIGEDSHLSTEPLREGIPLADEDLIPVLVDVLKTHFGAVDKTN